MSELAHVIKGDAFAQLIERMISEYKPRTILEIGSSDGTGSTSVLIEAMGKADLYCIEMEKDRFDTLVNNTVIYPNVHPYWCASVPVSGMMARKEIQRYHRRFPRFELWHSMGLKGILEWYDQSVAQIPTMEIQNGIEHIKHQNGITHFDMVLIDGSPFTGMAELQAVYGSGIIIMDDVRDIKCHEPMRTLVRDSSYKLLEANYNHRNGFAVFKKMEAKS